MRSGEVEEVVDPATGKKFRVRNENGRRIIVRSEDGENQARKVTRGTNVTERSLEDEPLESDFIAVPLTTEDEESMMRLKNQYLEKKSLFTIAYDGMNSKQSLLRDKDDSNNPPTVS